MIYLSAQSANFYFKWQVEVLLNNFNRLGIEKSAIHILFGFNGTIDKRVLNFIEKNSSLANFYLYEDSRENLEYVSSIRPHIIQKHFDYNPYLQNEVIFYHDADIIFREIPDFNNLSKDKIWYLSNANSYIGIDLLCSFNQDIIHELSKIVGIDIKTVYDNYNNFGGAQYLLKNVSSAFWGKHERDCRLIYKFLEGKLKTYQEKRYLLGESTIENSSIDFTYLQSWCADMWSMILNALYFGHNIEVSEELDFCWPTDSLENWERTKILHNAGVSKDQAFKLFYKGYFHDYAPFDLDVKYFDSTKCSIKYIEEIQLTSKNNRYNALDTVFLFIGEINSTERVGNLETSINYLDKYFQTTTMIIELGGKRNLNKMDLNSTIIYEFISKENQVLDNIEYIKQFSKKTTFKKIVYFDCDYIADYKSIIDCLESLNDEFALAIPYNNGIVKFKNLNDIANFKNELEINLLKKSFFTDANNHSFGKYLLINPLKFNLIINENFKVSEYGESVDIITKVLLNNDKVYRAEGILYKLST